MKFQQLWNRIAQLSFLLKKQLMEENKTPSTKEKKVLDELKEMDILEMTPLDAMNILYKLQKKLK